MPARKTHGSAGDWQRANHAHADRMDAVNARVAVSANPGLATTDGNAGDLTNKVGPAIRDHIRTEPAAAG